MADAIEEKRVYGDRTGADTLLIAAEAGLAAASVSGDRVGSVELVEACTPRAVAADGPRLAAATDADVLLADGTPSFEATGFGPAVAVGIHEGVTAAAPGGRIARLAPDSGEWRTLGRLESAAAIDRDLVATPDGVHRVAEGLPAVGLRAVRDVAVGARPLAATAEGLYALANGWTRRLAGDFRVVAAGGTEAHAATRSALYADGPGGWREVELPTEQRVVDVAYPGSPCVGLRDGTVLLRGEDAWRPYPTGLVGLVGLAATENAFEPPE